MVDRPGFVVLVAVQVHRHAGIIVERGQQIGKIATILEVRQAARRVSAAGNSVDAADALNAGEQVYEKVAGHALAVVGEAAPAEETLRIEGPFGRVAQPRLPVDGLRARIRGNWIHPCAGRGIAIGVGFDLGHLAEPAGLVNLRSFLEHDIADALAAGLKDALVLSARP